MYHKKDNKHIFWLMGPTSSGKTTLAKLLYGRLFSDNNFTLHFDGDEVRDTFGNNLGFSNNDRLLVVKTLVYVSNKGLDAGANVVVSALTAFNDARSYVKKYLNQSIVIYLRCSISECSRRDPKGLYAKEKRGEINTLVGASSIYNEPECPDIILDTEECTPEDSLQELISELGNKQINI
jgi:adenylylsulfate kinase